MGSREKNTASQSKKTGTIFQRNVTHYLDYELLRVITKIYATLRQIMADYGCYGNFFPLEVHSSRFRE